MTKLHFIWLRYLLDGVTENMPPNEKNKICITRGASLFLALFGPIFMVTNLAQGYFNLALVNLASTTLGVACWYLIRRKALRAAVTLLVFGTSILFFFSGLIFFNGMEYTLLLSMLAAVFAFESLSSRLLAFITNGAGFLVVEVLHFEPATQGRFPLPRYAINIDFSATNTFPGTISGR